MAQLQCRCYLREVLLGELVRVSAAFFSAFPSWYMLVVALSWMVYESKTVASKREPKSAGNGLVFGSRGEGAKMIMVVLSRIHAMDT